MLSYFWNWADSGFVWSCGYQLLIKAVASESVLSSRVVYMALSYSSFKILSATECSTVLTPQYQELWTLGKLPPCLLKWKNQYSGLLFWLSDVIILDIHYFFFCKQKGEVLVFKTHTWPISADSVIQKNGRVRKRDLPDSVTRRLTKKYGKEKEMWFAKVQTWEHRAWSRMQVDQYYWVMYSLRQTSAYWRRIGSGQIRNILCVVLRSLGFIL